jgi:hypothetical protein
MDYCISNQVIIDFLRKKLILKDDDGNKTEVAFVDVGQVHNATADNPEVKAVT